MARAQLKREYTYSVDNASFITRVMPYIWQLVEGRFYPLAEERGLQVEREQKVVKTSSGHPVGGIHNFTWKARKGVSAGFSLELEHDPKNYFHITLTAKPFYPLAIVVSLVLGVVLSYFWIPYLISNWGELYRNWLMIGAVIVMWVIFVLLTRTIFLAGILAFLSSFAFGFIVGYGIGWAMGMVVAQGQHGQRIQPALESLINGLDNPPVSGAGPPAYRPPDATASYPPATAVKYASPAADPAPSADPGPRLPTPKLVGPKNMPASTISMAACPQCRGSVAVGALTCQSCGLGLQWS